MEKFNVGDRVKLIKRSYFDKFAGLKEGLVGTVVDILPYDGYVIKFDDWRNGWGEDEEERKLWWTFGYMLEKNEETKTKVKEK